jgi:hypothetical protein
MGSTTIIDIIASAVIAGILLLMCLRLNAQANETSSIYNGSVVLQQNIVALVGWIEHDFRGIGYCQDWTKIPDPSLSIRRADTSYIRFWTDFPPYGTLDSVTWVLGPLETSTENPRDRWIYRITNTDTSKWRLGVTQFRLTYFDYDGTQLTTMPVPIPGDIFTLQIAVACEAPYPFREEYRSVRAADSLAEFQVFWRQLRLAARNLKAR